MERAEFLKQIKKGFQTHPVVAILGPRQCGKTTLALMYAKQKKNQITHFDLEDPEMLAQLQNPKQVLSELTGLIIIDEIQCRPELFPLLRVLVDQRKNQQFLILGSASRELIRQSSETLAGRIQYLELTPFNFQETNDLTTLWMRGGFPKSYLAGDNMQSFEWRKAYIQTYFERDLPKLGIKIAPPALLRFWNMLAHYHGNIFNASEIARSLQINYKTARSYLDILTGTFMVRELFPWYENIKKRQVKSPKIYFRDSGIYHSLLNIANHQQLIMHPKLGASWEGIAIEEIIRHHKARPEECFFWASHAHAELDLLIVQYDRKLAFEFKYSDAPKLTKSMRIALDDLKLDQMTVIYPGDKRFPLAEKVTAVGLTKYLEDAPE